MNTKQKADKMDLQTQLKKIAKSDLTIAKKKGVVCVTGTKVGNVQVRLVHGVLFRFENFNTGELLHSAHGANTMKEAVEYLASLYQVEVA